MNKRPMGTRVLLPEEHVNTVSELNNRKKELQYGIENMSVTLYTTRAQNQFKGFVHSLDEVDKALTVFNRKKVLVKA